MDNLKCNIVQWSQIITPHKNTPKTMRQIASDLNVSAGLVSDINPIENLWPIVKHRKSQPLSTYQKKNYQRISLSVK